MKNIHADNSGIASKVLLITTFFVVLFAILLTAARHFTHIATQYRAQIEMLVARVIKEPVSIGAMSAQWRGVSPIVSFDDVIVFDNQHKPLVHLHELGFQLDLLNSILHRRVELGFLSIDGVDLTVRESADGQFSVVGMNTNADANSSSGELIIPWLLQQGQLQLTDMNVIWYRPNGQVVHLLDIEMGLNNSLDSHYIWGRTHVGDKTHSYLKFIIDLKGSWPNYKNWQAKFYLKCNNWALDEWLDQKSWHNLTIKKGLLNLQTWGEWNNNQISELQSVVTLNHLQIATPSNSNINADLTANLQWNHLSADQWRCRGQQVKLTIDNKAWPMRYFNLTYAPNSQALLMGFIPLDIPKKIALQLHLLTDDQIKLLQELQPTGELHHVLIKHDGELNTTPSNNVWYFDSVIRNIAIAPTQNYPGIRNLSGHVRYMPTQFNLAIQSDNFILDWPTLFRNKLEFNKLAAQIDAFKQDQQWRIQVQDFFVQNSDLTAYSNALIQQTNDQGPKLSLDAGVRVTDASHKSLYLPKKYLNPEVIAWLDRAIVSGEVTKSTLLIRGLLNDFPFDKATGVFLSDSNLKNIELEYMPHWPAITNLDAHMSFSGRSMQIVGNSGAISGTTINNLSAQIPKMDGTTNALLLVSGHVSGDLTDGLNFIHHSSLQDSLGKQMQVLDWQGPMELGLRLSIPLEDEKAPILVYGDLEFNKSQLELVKWNAQIEDLSGRLQFTQNSINANNIQGLFFDKPFTMSIQTFQNGPNNTYAQANLTGAIAMDNLKDYLGTELPKYVTGSTKFEGIVTFPLEGTSTQQIQLNSDLVGIASTLPAPLTKTEIDPLPTTAVVQIQSENNIGVKVNLASRLSTALNLATSGKSVSITSGILKFGTGDVDFTNQPGLTVEGSLKDLPWQDWKNIFWKKDTKTSSQGFSDLVKSVRFRLDNYTVFGMVLEAVDVLVSRQEAQWILNFTTKNFAGQATIPDLKSRPWQVDMQRCYFMPQQSSQKSNVKPQDIPTLNFSCSDFRYGDRNFGSINFSVVNQPQGLLISRLQLGNRDYRILAEGNWQLHRGTSLQGDISSTNVARMLRSLGFNSSVESKQANGKFDLQWNGAPYDFSPGNLNGSLSLNIRQGAIVELDSQSKLKMNVGKLLNVLSVQSITRHLSMDFSDLTTTGLNFDVIQGDFQLQQGNAITNNAFLKGPVAHMQLRGRIGLANEDYDVMVKVEPQVTASVPIVATIAGGPVVGLVAYAASTVLSAGVQKITTYTYKVTGPWSNPNIQRVSSW